jgi:hypothetical protein
MTIESIMVRLAATTPGPWDSVKDSPGSAVVAPKEGVIARTQSERDAEFIAHAPNDMELLLELAMAVRRYHQDADQLMPDNWSAVLRQLRKIEDSD